MPNADKIRTEIARLGDEYADAQKALAKVEKSLGKQLAKAQTSSELTMSDAARLAKIDRSLAYKIIRRSGLKAQ
jgi:transcriptional regulator of acetoin/glycerol metabolism